MKQFEYDLIAAREADVEHEVMKHITAFSGGRMGYGRVYFEDGFLVYER